MRLEDFPLVLGGPVTLIGAGFLADAWMPDGRWPFRERRRRVRRERSRVGETLVGLGMAALAAALVGRDQWRYGTVSVALGAVLLLWGAWFNRAYLRELLTFRGPARRGEKRTDPRMDPALRPPMIAPIRAESRSSVRRPTPRPMERERPIDAPGLVDVPAPPMADGEPPDHEPPAPKRMRIR